MTIERITALNDQLEFLEFEKLTSQLYPGISDRLFGKSSQ